MEFEPQLTQLDTDPTHFDFYMQVRADVVDGHMWAYALDTVIRMQFLETLITVIDPRLSSAYAEFVTITSTVSQGTIREGDVPRLNVIFPNAADAKKHLRAITTDILPKLRQLAEERQMPELYFALLDMLAQQYSVYRRQLEEHIDDTAPAPESVFIGTPEELLARLREMAGVEDVPDTPYTVKPWPNLETLDFTNYASLRTSTRDTLRKMVAIPLAWTPEQTRWTASKRETFLRQRIIALLDADFERKDLIVGRLVARDETGNALGITVAQELCPATLEKLTQALARKDTRKVQKYAGAMWQVIFDQLITDVAHNLRVLLDKEEPDDVV